MVEALSESHVLAEKSGIETNAFHVCVETIFPGPYTAYSKRLIEGDYYKRDEPLFAIDLARKDARHALDLAKASGVKMRAVEAAADHLHK